MLKLLLLSRLYSHPHSHAQPSAEVEVKVKVEAEAVTEAQLKLCPEINPANARYNSCSSQTRPKCKFPFHASLFFIYNQSLEANITANFEKPNSMNQN